MRHPLPMLGIAMFMGGILSAVSVGAARVQPKEDANDPPGFQRLWNGTDHSGWDFLNCTMQDWVIKDEVLSTRAGKKARNNAWILTEMPYDDFELHLEFLLGKGADSGLVLRAAPAGVLHLNGIRIPLVDDDLIVNVKLEATGALYGIAAPAQKAAAPVGQWNQLQVTVNERKLKVVINDITVQDVDLDELKKATPKHLGLPRDAGHIGLQTRVGAAQFRNVIIKPLSETPSLGKVTLTFDAGGHTARIGKVFFTKDGTQLVTGAADHTVRVWDVATGEPRRVLRPPGVGDLAVMAVSPTEDKVAVACQYPEGKKLHHVIYLLRLEDGQVERVFRGHKEHILGLAFSADGKRLASSADDKTVRVWDPATAEAVRVIQHKRASHHGSIALSPKGDRLACLVWRQVALVFEVATGKLQATLALPPNSYELAWSPDGNAIATSGWEKTLKDGSVRRGFSLWNPDGTLLPRQPEGPLRTNAVTYSKDGRRILLTASNANHLAALIDLDTGKPIVTFTPPKAVGNPGSGLSGALAPDGTLAASVGTAGFHQAFLWNTADGKQLQRLAAHHWDQGQIAWSPDGKSVAWGNPKGKTRPQFDLGELRLGTTSSPGMLRGPIRKEGDLTLERQEPNKRYWEMQVVKESKVIARLGVPHVPSAVSFVGPERVAMASDYGRFFLHDIAAQKPIREFKLAEGKIRATSMITSVAASPGKCQLLATTGKDQLLRIWSQERDRPLLTLYVHGQDWIIWTEEGYYAATPGGERLIGWTVDNGIDKSATFHAADRFRKQFHRPDVIKLVLENCSVAEALKAANAVEKIETRDVKVEDLLPPRVVLTVDDSKKPTYKLKVRAEASTKDQPIKSLRLRIDGKIVPGNETLAEFPGGKAKAEVEWTIDLPEGEHQLNVMARSPDSTGFSAPIRLKHVDAKKQPVLHVLTVGINNYKDGALDLKFAVPDAKALAAAFEKHCKGQPFLDVKTKTLPNEKATTKQIENALLEMRKGAQPQDLVVVFFACHGVMHKKEYYLLTHEADTDKLDTTCLSGASLRKTLTDYKCQVLLMLDACHSAGFGDGKKLSKLGLKPATDDATRDLTDDDVGVAVMCAAMAHEKAEGVGGNGLFTKAVLEALAGGPKVPVHPFNQRLYVHHLQSYVFDHVSHYSEERQHPFLSLPWIVESFPVR